jgi:hypothetical protein
MQVCKPSPSSGDCEVAAERGSLETGTIQFDTEMAAPDVRLRTPTGTGGKTLHSRVRMEAGRIGGGEIREGRTAPPVESTRSTKGREAREASSLRQQGIFGTPPFPFPPPGERRGGRVPPTPEARCAPAKSTGTHRCCRLPPQEGLRPPCASPAAFRGNLLDTGGLLMEAATVRSCEKIDSVLLEATRGP